MLCQHCQGQRYIKNPTTHTMVTCPYCKGTGTITQVA